MKNENLKTLGLFISEQYAKRENAERDRSEKDWEVFNLGALIQEARLEKGMTQSELAEKIGSNKGYISRVENNVKEMRFPTLLRIVEVGLGGKLELTIKL